MTSTAITPAQLAACLEQEWAGILFPGECLDPLDGLSRWRAGTPPFLPSVYHGATAERILGALGERRGAIRHVREIGGGTGGFAREFLARVAVESFDLVELSAEKARYADHLLNGRGTIRGFPILGADFSLRWRPVPPPAPVAGGVGVRTGDGARGDAAQVDLAVALNVADRVARPRDFVRAIAGQVRPGGFLALASPLDWLAGVTPTHERVNSLEDLVPDGFHAVGGGEDLFPFRSHPRRVVLFLSRLLVLEKQAAESP